MMRLIPLILLVELLGVASGQAALLRETWGAKIGHKGTLTVTGEVAAARIAFDLSAIPKDAAIRRALLRNEKIRQPQQAVRIFAIEKLNDAGAPAVAGKPLALLPPRYQWFDATDAVKRWVKDPRSNLGLSLASAEGFDPDGAFLDIWYEGEARNLPSGVTGLTSVRHDGQTFLTWDDLPMYRPDPADVVWVSYDKKPFHVWDGPGEGYMGKPRIAGIKQKTLRKLQRFEVVNSATNSMSRERPKLIRTGPWPDVSYRVYRSREKITPRNIRDAEWIGDARPLGGFDQSMVKIVTWGEYYDPRENPEGFIPTYCLEDGRSIPPGRAFLVYTAPEEGDWYYAVTVAQDGVENFEVVSGQSSLAAPVAEKTAPLKPVLQYPSVSWGTVLYKYYLWDGPPLSTPAMQGINKISVWVAPNHQSPGWLNVVRFAPANVYDSGNVMMGMDFGNGIGYSQGRNTFLSQAESKADYYDERTWSRMMDWVCEEWKIDPTHGIGAEGHYVPPLYCFRNPDRIKYLNTQPSGLGYDWVWRPSACSLGSLLGPRPSALTVDGLPAWNLWHLGWYLKRDPARDAPFCYWTEQQEGPEISFLAVAAMRDARQPFASEWGGGKISSPLRRMLRMMRWDRSVPAFGRCSLDANPGSGWRPDGDPRGQINGFLIWDYATQTETADQWEMAIGLTPEAPLDQCTVDLTPRHCKTFKPKPGDKFQWTNTNEGGQSEAQAGEVTADAWGLVTLSDLKVRKGSAVGDQAKPENRIRIVRKK